MAKTKIEITSEGNEVWVDGKLVKAAEPKIYTDVPSDWPHGVYRQVGFNDDWFIIVAKHGWVYTRPPTGSVSNCDWTHCSWERVREAK